MTKQHSPTTSVPDDSLEHIKKLFDIYATLPTGANKRRLLHLIESYGNHRELEGRIDEYLNAEQAWLNYVQDDYFNDRQGQLESQKETHNE